MIETNPFSELAEFSEQQAHDAKNFRNIFLGFTTGSLIIEGCLKLSSVEVPPAALYFPLSFTVLSGMSEFGRRWNIRRISKMQDEAVVLDMLVDDPTSTERQIALVIEAERIARKADTNT